MVLMHGQLAGAYLNGVAFTVATDHNPNSPWHRALCVGNACCVGQSQWSQSGLSGQGFPGGQTSPTVSGMLVVLNMLTMLCVVG